MAQSGVFNPAFPVETFGFKNLKNVYYNLTAPALYEESLRRDEAVLAAGGALVAETGAHTGRSAKDKFVVRDETTENNVWWDNNGAITTANFDALLEDFLKHAEGKDLFVQDLFGGADPAHRVKARVVTEFAWHSLFISNLLINPTTDEVLNNIADLTIVDLPSFRADPEASRLPHRDHHRGEFRQKDRPDRRHLLRRRDEEVGLHLSQLYPAAGRRDADALLRQCRRRP